MWTALFRFKVNVFKSFEARLMSNLERLSFKYAHFILNNEPILKVDVHKKIVELNQTLKFE